MGKKKAKKEKTEMNYSRLAISQNKETHGNNEGSNGTCNQPTSTTKY